MAKWKIYDPDAAPAKRRVKLPPPPPWRRPGPARREAIASTFRASKEVVDAVNVALHLSRPLLITGKPGTGKSSLVYSVARQLALGEVFVWAINSRSTLSDGLYRYDALARLQRIQEQQASSDARMAAARRPGTKPDAVDQAHEIGEFIKLGPLGSALAAPDAPRALLIDEIDKSDIDLPNDLLSVLDTGAFPIDELERVAEGDQSVMVRNWHGQPIEVAGGGVSFDKYPFIVMTSNGERDFPAPFLRRCVQCELPEPDESMLNRIVRAHLPELTNDKQIELLLQDFVAKRAQDALATDQLLNAQYLMGHGSPLAEDRQDLLDIVFKSLNG